jgi:hypothetical protein
LHKYAETLFYKLITENVLRESYFLKWAEGESKLDKYSATHDKKLGKKLIKNLDNLVNHLKQEVENESEDEEEAPDTAELD